MKSNQAVWDVNSFSCFLCDKVYFQVCTLIDQGFFFYVCKVVIVVTLRCMGKDDCLLLQCRCENACIVIFPYPF